MISVVIGFDVNLVICGFTLIHVLREKHVERELQMRRTLSQKSNSIEVAALSCSNKTHRK